MGAPPWGDAARGDRCIGVESARAGATDLLLARTFARRSRSWRMRSMQSTGDRGRAKTKMSGYSHLLSGGRLAQGSAPPPNVSLPFDVIVLAALEYQPEMPGYEVLRVPLDDGPPPSPQTRAEIRAAAGEVARRVRAGQRVLVTCWQGRNRSGVISGLALVDLGVPGTWAAHRIRRIRNGLTNPHFYEMVIRS